MVKLLNEHLADATDLFCQIKQAHWNVKGPNFIALHELFDKLAEEVEGTIDTIAERATALGGTAEGTVQIAAQRTRLPQPTLQTTDGRDHLSNVAQSLASFGRSVRKAIATSGEAGDAGTSDLFTQVSREADKQLWFIEAHLQAER